MFKANNFLNYFKKFSLLHPILEVTNSLPLIVELLCNKRLKTQYKQSNKILEVQLYSVVNYKVLLLLFYVYE